MIGNSNAVKDTRLFGYPAQMTVYGKPVPMIYGTNRVAPIVIWYGDWQALAGGSGKFGSGKGAAGKNGGGQYDYQAALQMLLCRGPVSGIGTIFVDKIKLLVARYTETVIVPSGGLVVPTGLTGYINDLGVGQQQAYSHVANDYGSPGAVTLSGTQVKPLAATTSAPATGQYQLVGQVSSIVITNPGHSYTSAPAVTLDPPPAGGVQATAIVSITGPHDFVQGLVQNPVITNPGSGYTTPPGVHFSGGGGSGASAFSNLANSYQFAAGDYGTTVVINYGYVQITTSEASDQAIPVQNLNLALFIGEPGQQPWGYLVTNHPSQALGYTRSAYVANQNFDLGSSGLLSNYSFEVIGSLTQGAGVQDAEPTQIVSDFLTNPYDGVGLIPSELGDFTEVATYNVANGLYISPVLDSQQQGRQWLQEWIEKVSNAAFLWSDGCLKMRSYGDKTVIGNGVTYTPNTTPIYDIDDDNYILTGPDDPLTIERPSVRDQDNVIAVEWSNRGNSYSYEPLLETDDSSARLYGLRPRNSDPIHSITTQPVAQLVAITQLRRSVWVTNHFKFKLDAISFALLEPMDLVTLRDDVEFGFGEKHPARVVTLDENDSLELEVECEDFPWSAASPTLFPKQPVATPGAGYYAAPGSVNPPMFVPLPSEVSTTGAPTLGFALSGGPNWGGAEVFASTDGGSTYLSIGRQVGLATMGKLTASLPNHIDPDTADTLSVDLTQSFGELVSYTDAQRDNFESLIAVETELLSYKTAVLTAQYEYDITSLRRGVYDSIDASHASGTQFCVVNQSLFQWAFPASVIGTTVYFKFCSINSAGQREELLSNVTAYPYFVPAPRLPWRWNAGYAGPIIGDAIYTAENFSPQQLYDTMRNGDPLPIVNIWGNPPLSIFSKFVGPPIISVTSSPSGGSITGPATFVIAVNCFDAATNAGISKLSNLAIITLPSGSSQKITVTVTWPTGSYGGQVYVATTDTSLGFHLEGTFGAGSPTTGNVAYDITALTQEFIGPPDDQFDHFVFRISREFVSGTWGQVAAAVTHVDATHGIIALGAGGGSTDDCKGRTITKLADALGATPDLFHILPSFTITGNDTSGNFTVTPDPTAHGCRAGDLFTMRSGGSGTGDGTGANGLVVTANSYRDPLFINPYSAGLTVHGNSGNAAIVIAGTGAGQPPVTVIDNTADTVTVTPWTIIPDATSVIVLINSDPPQLVIGNSLQLASYAGFQGNCAQLQIPNYSGAVVRIEVYTADALGLMDSQQFVSFAEMYIWGAQGTRTVGSSQTQQPTDSIIQFDTSVPDNPAASSTTLSGGITSGATSLVLGASYIPPNGTYLTIQAETSNTTESVLVTAGSGTATLTIVRGQLGTSPSAHSNGATVNVPGGIEFDLLPIEDVPNQNFFGHKNTNDINYVDVVDPAGVHYVLSDTTDVNGTIYLKAPGA